MDNKVVTTYLRGEPAISLMQKARDPNNLVVSYLSVDRVDTLSDNEIGAFDYRDYIFNDECGDEGQVIGSKKYHEHYTHYKINVGWRFHGSKIRRMHTFAESILEKGIISLPLITLKNLIQQTHIGEILQPHRVSHLGKVIGLYFPEDLYRTLIILDCWQIGKNVPEARKEEGWLSYDAVPNFAENEKYSRNIELFIHFHRKKGDIYNFHGVGLPSKNMDVFGLPQTNGSFVPFNRPLHRLVADNAFWSVVVEKYPIENIPDNPDDWMDYLDIKKKAPPAEPTEAGDSSSASPPASASQPVAPAPKPRLKHRPPALLNGLDAATLLEEVMTNPLGLYQCVVEGPTALEIKLPAAPAAPTGRTRGPRVAKGKPKLLDLEEAAVRSRIAVMEWRQFRLEVEYRRYAAEHRLERLLGRKLHLDRAYTEHIKPEQLGEVPALVAGLHRPQRDRLCVVCLTYPKPEGTEDAEPIKLAFFPSFWLKDVTRAWVPGLFGTPHDPALLDFCETMPPEWYAALKSVMPPEADNLDIFDIRAL